MEQLREEAWQRLLPFHLLTNQPNYLPEYIPTCIPTSRSIFSPTYRVLAICSIDVPLLLSFFHSNDFVFRTSMLQL